MLTFDSDLRTFGHILKVGQFLSRHRERKQNQQWYINRWNIWMYTLCDRAIFRIVECHWQANPYISHELEQTCMIHDVCVISSTCARLSFEHVHCSSLNQSNMIYCRYIILRDVSVVNGTFPHLHAPVKQFQIAHCACQIPTKQLPYDSSIVMTRLHRISSTTHSIMCAILKHYLHSIANTYIHKRQMRPKQLTFQSFMFVCRLSVDRTRKQ